MGKSLSFIMQSFLGDYPGSRSNSKEKFIRAVNSFLELENVELCELIIVSDGCEITHNIYHELFAENESIKYAYVSKPKVRMYEEDENRGQIYRGLPRQIGRELTDSVVTTYLDSDDYLQPNAANILISSWQAALKSDTYYNLATTQAWYDNVDGGENPDKDPNVQCDHENAIEIPKLKGKWHKRYVKGNMANSATMAISHLSVVSQKWKDVNKKETGMNEDGVFFLSIQKDQINHSAQIFSIQEPYYVRCHYPDKWDY
jgi:hypothetical protein